MVNNIELILVATALDIVSGLLNAAKSHKISSTYLRNGFYKKVAFFLLWAAAYLIAGYAAENGIEGANHILPFVTVYLFVTEMISVLENVSLLSPGLVPDKLKDMLKSWNENEGH